MGHHHDALTQHEITALYQVKTCTIFSQHHLKDKQGTGIQALFQF